MQEAPRERGKLICNGNYPRNDGAKIEGNASFPISPVSTEQESSRIPPGADMRRSRLLGKARALSSGAEPSR